MLVLDSLEVVVQVKIAFGMEEAVDFWIMGNSYETKVDFNQRN